MHRTRTAALATVLSLIVGFGEAAAANGAPTSADDTDMGLSSFADDVETLGVTQFPNTFADASVNPTGAIDIYVTNTNDTDLTSAVASLNTDGFPVNYIGASRSYNELDALSSALAAAEPQLEVDGVEFWGWGPDAATGTVDVTLVEPTTDELARLSSSGITPSSLGPMTVGNYVTAVSAAISSVVGSGYTVDPILQTERMTGDADTSSSIAETPNAVEPDAGRSAGVAPFAGGDFIQSSGPFPNNCTSGFAVKGLNTGDPFILSAGHCGQSTWSTPAQTMGPTSTIYLNNNFDDFQTIRVGSARGSVNGNLVQYSVVGQVIPATNSKLTVDGAKTLEQNNRVVTNNNEDLLLQDKNGARWVVRHGIVVNWPCQGGDSGGPMFVRQPNNRVKAVGTIVAGGSDCGAERILSEEAASNTILILNATVVVK